MAEQAGARGHALLKAVLWGFEAACRIGMAVGPAHYKVWHNTATCGPFGAALAAASILNLNDGRILNALGNAGTQSSGVWEFLSTGAMSKHLHAGRAAESGIIAATLAAKGFTGPPSILEGEKGFFRAACPDADPHAVLRDPNAPWQLHETSIKPWPSCRHTHPAIDAASELAPGLNLSAVQIVSVKTYAAALDICDRARPRSVYEAKFSLQHCVAAALSGPVDFAIFEATAQEQLASLRARVHVEAAEPFASAYPKACGAAVDVKLNDGRVLHAVRRHAKGDPQAALSRDEMIEKARMLFEYGGVKRPQGLIDDVLALADDTPLPKLAFV